MGDSNKTFILRVESIDIEVTRKDVKNLRMRVGADGTVKLSAPRRAMLADIERFAYANRAWMHDAVARVAASGRALSPADGGTFMLWGNPLTLRVEPAARSEKPRVEGSELVVVLAKERCDSERLAKACNAFLADEVRRALDEGIVARMESICGVHANGWKVRSMTSRWGSCQVQKRTITINAQLAHYPKHCLEYVVCHELCHLIEPSHSQRFHGLMDRFYPGWKAVRKELRG